MRKLYILLVGILFFGCVGMQVNNDEITEFAIESTAMIIASEMKGAFDWSEVAEDYYLAIMEGGV